jgi:hypothetical protein
VPLCLAGLWYYILVLAIEYVGRKLDQSHHSIAKHAHIS